MFLNPLEHPQDYLAFYGKASRVEHNKVNGLATCLAYGGNKQDLTNTLLDQLRPAVIQTVMHYTNGIPAAEHLDAGEQYARQVLAEYERMLTASAGEAPSDFLAFATAEITQRLAAFINDGSVMSGLVH
ncbi:hypothetical protein [Ferrimonas marina]|uniref:Uncharacterized protein n=1 Tax=Ferrimonas marina TaxID=299255 RepID=A0A1M5UCF5_9GAMM|nr:hypothetical protein [Ferrimonas marina]SHH60735.1 hypothetical protein SAMN02745129_2505 [Ferrimonas marina]